MKQREHKKIIYIFLICVAVISGALFVYMRMLWNTVQANTLETMREIAAHDKKSIEGENAYSWELLQQVCNRLQESEPANISEVCRRLNLESSSSYYEGIYLVDDTGRCYSHTGAVTDGSDTGPVQQILDGAETFAVNFRTGNSIELYQDYLAYGISFPVYTVADVNYIGMYVLTKTHTMENRMKLDSFSGQGLTSVFDTDGYYVVRKDQKTNIAKRENYYEQLQEQYGCTDAEIKQLKEQLSSKTPFTQTFTRGDGTDIITCYGFIDDTDWTMVLEVPKSAISKNVRSFVWQVLIILVLVTIAITVLTALILRLRNKTVHAQAQAAARAQFLANMSHEIRTPLNGIIGLNHLMTLNLDNPEKLKDYLEKSSSAEHFLLALINDILDVQKIQAGKMELIEAPFSVDDMITTMEIIMQERMKEKSITFTVTKEIVCSDLIGDETRIQQILINILGNAAKFTDNNGHVEFRIHQTRIPDSSSVTTVYEIEDDGCGMSPEFCKVIFDAFSQDPAARKATSVHGSGLGMNISHELSRQMGGDLCVTSEPGIGSCFTLTLTNRIADSESADSPADIDPTPEEKPLHILIAEDNELNAEILSELLHNIGHQTTIATDGEAVVREFEQSPAGSYDLILMDMQMPKQDGCQAAAQIRALDRSDAKTVLIFACTANTFREDVERALQAGMNDFIAKPIDIPKLTEKLKRR